MAAMLRWILVLIGLAWAPPAMAEDLVPVPFIGCPGEGQQGSVDAIEIGDVPSLPASLAARLAWYRGPHIGALAPRGWHCAELFGGAASVLLITPEYHEPDLLWGAPGFTGPFIIADVAYGDSDGRFDIASIAAPLFPIAKKFVQDVLLEPNTRARLVPVVNDTLTRRSDTVVGFVTAANKDGLGTRGWTQKSALPVSGVAILLPIEQIFNLAMMRVRLPVELADLAPVIIDQKVQAIAACDCTHQP